MPRETTGTPCAPSSGGYGPGPNLPDEVEQGFPVIALGIIGPPALSARAKIQREQPPGHSGFLDHEKLILQLAESRAWVDFTQGLDIRLITPDNVALLNKVRTKAVHFAWDNPYEDLTEQFLQFLELTNIHSARRRRVYVLTNFGSTHEQDLYRVETLRGMGYDPYVMVYDRPNAPAITRQLQRWVNNKRIFNTVQNFADYIPGRLGGKKKDA